MRSFEGKGMDFHKKQDLTENEFLLFPGYWLLATSDFSYVFYEKSGGSSSPANSSYYFMPSETRQWMGSASENPSGSEDEKQTIPNPFPHPRF